MTESDFTLELTEIADNGASIETMTQYGIITPDNVTHWRRIVIGGTGHEIEHILNGHPSSVSVQKFRGSVRHNLEPLGVNYETYLGGLKFIKRTVVVSVLNHESVKHPWKAPAQDVPF